jgi:diacylglycerol kinase family enzyme
LEADALFSVQMDGEPAFNTRQAVISVRQRAIRVLLPPHSFGLLKNPPRFD